MNRLCCRLGPLTVLAVPKWARYRRYRVWSFNGSAKGNLTDHHTVARPGDTVRGMLIVLKLRLYCHLRFVRLRLIGAF